MAKTLYSLILSDDVIREIDEEARAIGTNRSRLINQILADHVSLKTPAEHINDIFSAMEELLRPCRELTASFMPFSPSFSLKSSIDYRYRPTVRYELRLGEGESDGAMTVIFRTQASELLSGMGEFFRIFARAEREAVGPVMSEKLDYALYDGRFVRNIPRGFWSGKSPERAAEALSDYVRLFDGLMKRYLVGDLSENELRAELKAAALRREIVI